MPAVPAVSSVLLSANGHLFQIGVNVGFHPVFQDLLQGNPRVKSIVFIPWDALRADFLDHFVCFRYTTNRCNSLRHGVPPYKLWLTFLRYPFPFTDTRSNTSPN